MEGIASSGASATALVESTPLHGAASSHPVQAIPIPLVVGTFPTEGIPSADGSPAAQGIPNSQVSGALPRADMPSPHANSPPAQVTPKTGDKQLIKQMPVEACNAATAKQAAARSIISKNMDSHAQAGT